MSLSHLLSGFSKWEKVNKHDLEYAGLDLFERYGVPYPTMQYVVYGKRYKTFWFYIPKDTDQPLVLSLVYDSHFDQEHVSVETYQVFSRRVTLLKPGKRTKVANPILPIGNDVC